MKSLKQLGKGFVVAKKRRVHSGRTWLTVGLLVGIVAGVAYVANKTGQFDSTFAAEGFTLSGKLSYFGPVIPNRTMLGVRTQANGETVGVYIIKQAHVPFYEDINIASGATMRAPKANAFGFTEPLNTGTAGTMVGTLTVLKNSQIYYIIPKAKTPAHFNLTLANTAPVSTFQARTSVEDGTLVDFVAYNGGAIAAGTKLTFNYKNTATTLGIWLVPTSQSENGSTATVMVTDADDKPLPNMPVALTLKARIGNTDPVVGTGRTDANGKLAFDLSSWLSPAVDYKAPMFTLSTVWGAESKTEKKGNLSTHELLNGKGVLVIPVAQPVAVFTGPSIIQANAQVTFDASKSSVKVGSIKSYKWNFGEDLDPIAIQGLASLEGQSADPGSLVLFGEGDKKEKHSYPLSAVGKTFPVSLQIIDSNGNVAYARQDVTITAPTVKPIKAPTPITATIKSTKKVVVGKSVPFTAAAKGVPTTEALYSWYFGDETADAETGLSAEAEATTPATPSATGKIVNHTYTVAGTYTATLLVSNSKTGQISAPATTRITVTDGKPVDRSTPDFIIKNIDFGVPNWIEGQIPPKFTVEVENLNPGTYVGEVEVGVKSSVLALNGLSNAIFNRGFESGKGKFVAGSDTALVTFKPDTKIPSPITTAMINARNAPGRVRAEIMYTKEGAPGAGRNNKYVGQIPVIPKPIGTALITPKMVGPTTYREAHFFYKTNKNNQNRGGIYETVDVYVVNNTSQAIPAGETMNLTMKGVFAWNTKFSGAHLPNNSRSYIASSCAFKGVPAYNVTVCYGEVGAFEAYWYSIALPSELPVGGEYKVASASFLIPHIGDSQGGNSMKKPTAILTLESDFNSAVHYLTPGY